MEAYNAISFKLPLKLSSRFSRLFGFVRKADLGRPGCRMWKHLCLGLGTVYLLLKQHRIYNFIRQLFRINGIGYFFCTCTFTVPALN